MDPEEGREDPQLSVTEDVGVRQEPVVERGEDLRCRVTGVFHRAVDGAHRAGALDGSRLPGRYSATGQPTLYLSSSVEGVAAAMVAHGGAQRDLAVLRFSVQADGIVDLRDPSALAAVGVDLEDAVAPWQEVVAAGGVPRSWAVRRRLEDLGAEGLIDPSRTQPGLWHLVLFRWNADGGPRVVPLQA